VATENSNELVYRFTAKTGENKREGVWSVGKRLLPPELVEEANANRAWLNKPTLPRGDFRFWMTDKGRAMYESSLKRVHNKYLQDIQVEAVSREKLGEIVYQDEFQVVEKI